MKITYILDAFDGGGKEHRCLQILQGLNRAGYEDIQVILVNENIDYPDLLKIKGRVDIVGKNSNHLSQYHTYLKIRKLLDAFQPDVVQSWGLLSSLYINIYRINHRFRYYPAYVANCNRLKPRNIHFWTNLWTCRVADGVIGNSKLGLEVYSIPKEKRICIYNGFNDERVARVRNLDANRLKEELGVKGRRVICMIGRVDGNKDFDSFIELAKIMHSKDENLLFLCVGKGCRLEHYRTIVETEQDYIKFLGFRSDTDCILSISDVNILFTNYKQHKEGISNVILESMYLGVPVIATDDGGSPEIIDSGHNGFLVKNNSISQTIDYINRLMDDDVLKNQMTSEAKKTIREQFGFESNINKYIELYERAY